MARSIREAISMGVPRSFAPGVTAKRLGGTVLRERNPRRWDLRCRFARIVVNS